MKKLLLLTAVVAALGACTPREQNTATGAVVGAGAGALIGGAATGRASGALAGAAIGVDAGPDLLRPRRMGPARQLLLLSSVTALDNRAARRDRWAAPLRQTAP